MNSIVRFSLASAVLSFLLLALTPEVDAQRKLYRWTDKDGKVHYTDSLPAEAANDKQEELNRQGMAVKTIERARTPEEQAAWEEEQAALAKERAVLEERQKMDSVLMGSYPTEADLKRAYTERFDLIEQSVESARIGIRNQEKSLAELLQHAADLERNNQKVPVGISESITRTRTQVSEQRTYLSRREAERDALQSEYDGLLTRYRELKAEASSKH